MLNINSKKPDLILVTETWFGPNSAKEITGYSCKNRDRLTHGGGVAIYSTNGIITYDITDKTLIATELEQIWIGVKMGKENILVGCIYHPHPNVKSTKLLSKSLTHSNQLVKKKQFTGLLVCGDFNFPEITWDDDHTAFTTKNENSPEQIFIDCLENEFLIQHVIEPTYI